MNEENLVERAYAAWNRKDELDQPSQSVSGVTQSGGKWYVRLANTNGILAVYRVLNSGKLRRLRRWPESLETY